MSTTMDYSAFKYPKMELFRKADLKSLNPEESFVLVEKIHGSNAQFIYQGSDDGPTWQLGKRNGWITEEEMVNFYHIGQVFQLFITRLLEACETCCYELGLDSRHCQVSIFVELYGANVQKNMRYHNSETIAIFDIRVNEEFVPYEQMKTICINHNLPRAPEIQRGCLKELISTFQVEELSSKVPLELHSKNEENAPCEGVILRPVNQSGFVNRFKWKKIQFSERPRKETVFQEQNSELNQAIGYMNEMRLESYLSKVGPDVILNRKNIGSNIKALMQDCLVDLKTDFPDIIADKQLNKRLSCRAIKLINEFIFNYIPEEPIIEEQMTRLETIMSDTRKNIMTLRAHLYNINQRLNKL